MSQNDLVIDNQSFPATRSDINSALQALGSLNSGASAPATTYASMLWYDTTNNTLKMRSEANDQWISVGYLDQSADAFRIFDDTQVVNASGTQTGLIGDQATATWEAGTSTTESLVSPAKVKAVVQASTPASAFEFVASATAANNASLEFTLDNTTYFTHHFYFDSVIPGPTDALLVVQLSSDGGSTWDTTNTYEYGYNGVEGLNLTHVEGVATSTAFVLSPTGQVGSASTEFGVSGDLVFIGAGTTGRRIRFSGFVISEDRSSYMDGWQVWGQKNDTVNYNAVKFFFDNADLLESGTIKQYGVRHS